MRIGQFVAKLARPLWGLDTVIPVLGSTNHLVVSSDDLAVIHPYGLTADESRIDLISIKVSSMRDT